MRVNFIRGYGGLWILLFGASRIRETTEKLKEACDNISNGQLHGLYSNWVNPNTKQSMEGDPDYPMFS